MSKRLLVVLCICAAAIAGCGGSDDASRPAPAAAEFPSAKGKTIGDLLHDSGAKPSKLEAIEVYGYDNISRP